MSKLDDPHLVVEMHVHITCADIDPTQAPTREAIERVRRISLAYQHLLENVEPAGLTALQGCVTTVRSVNPVLDEDEDEHDMSAWLGVLTMGLLGELGESLS